MDPQASSAVIVCSTPRLARGLQLAHQRRRVQAGCTQWQPLQVMTLANWLQTVIEHAILRGEIPAEEAPMTALNATQETMLWERAIAGVLKGHEAADLFDTSGLARAAMEANRLLIEWNMSLDVDEATEETRQFLLWRQRFQELCREAGGLESVRYGGWQIACLEKGAGNLPASIQLAGFDRIHPQLQRLMGVLEKRGVRISEYPLTLPEAGDAAHIQLTDRDAESRAAVAWARQCLQQNPQVRVAIVVPELEVLRARISALLDDVFHPLAAVPAQAEITRCYDFSLGIPLSALPIIQTALDLLRLAWQKQELMQPDVARLLRSAYWSASLSEADARARLDARVRAKLPLSFGVGRFASFIKNAVHGDQELDVFRLHDDLSRLLDGARQSPRLQIPSAWAATFTGLLQKGGWPGERSLSSHEFQARSKFIEVASQLSGLDALFGKINAQQAIQRLTQLCQAQVFQPESRQQASIQVMGMLEASAEPLDGIWVMGMNDHVWPPAARPNALIPAALQRKAGTPNSSHEVQSAFAMAIHQRLTQSAPRVIFSSSRKDGDRELRASPLMQGIPQKELEMLPASTLAERLAERSGHDWQWLEDHRAPPVGAGEFVAGGTALLRAQAICPAWAFYQYRLNARKLDEPVNGLDAMERGSLVHAVLARFWTGRDMHFLQELSAAELGSLLSSISHDVLEEFNRQNDGVFSQAFLTLESGRLVKLVAGWLTEMEMQRPQGFRVMACEEEHKISVEGIAIKLVVDRVDRLDDGRLVVLDYKTGRNMDYKNWAAESITEPQLPIYAAFVLGDADVAAVCFARVRAADHAFAGIAADDGLVSGVIALDEKRGRKIFSEEHFPDWAAVIRHWKERITATVHALKSGEAAVKVEDERQLEFCEVLPLLRLPERQLQFERQHKGGSAP